MSVCGTESGGDVMNNKLTIPPLSNQQFDYSGIDSLNSCLDPELFLQWPYQVNYKYNSRGFRDQEWPEDLKSAVWCIGDSFTVGIGSCIEHTWPQVLSQHSQRRVINVSMDGASNEWIARRACDVYDLAGPGNMVLMWSYLHRREHSDPDLSDQGRRMHHVKSTDIQDFENFNSCRRKVLTHCADSNVIELIIPNFSSNSFTDVAWEKIRDPSWPILLPSTMTECQGLFPDIVTELRTIHGIDINGLLEFQAIQQQHPEFLSDLIRVEYLDRARDGHHFDRLTAEWVAKQVQNLLNL
jgi:hypothetical protein